MTAYRIQYAPDADASRRAMDAGLQRRFEEGIRTLSSDPYGHGSTDIRGEKDRREVVVAGAVVVYYVSTTVLVVTAVRIVH